MPTDTVMHRDPLAQYLQQQDPASPEVRESTERARAAQRLARAHALQLMFETEPGPVFDRFFHQFYADDRLIAEAVRDMACYRRVAELLEAEGL